MNEVKEKLLVLGLGSNLGNRFAYLMMAIERLEEKIGAEVTSSSVYSSPPWGLKNQPQFLNMVVSFDTRMEVEKVHQLIQEIERELGKKKVEKWGPRCIDIDILFYGSEVVKEKQLVIPHPHLLERDFVVIPLLEIAPDLIHPQEQKSIRELTASLSNNTTIFA